MWFICTLMIMLLVALMVSAVANQLHYCAVSDRTRMLSSFNFWECCYDPRSALYYGVTGIISASSQTVPPHWQLRAASSHVISHGHAFVLHLFSFSLALQNKRGIHFKKHGVFNKETNKYQDVHARFFHSHITCTHACFSVCIALRILDALSIRS